MKYTGIGLTIGASLILLINYYLLANHLGYFNIVSLVGIQIPIIWLGIKYDLEKGMSERDYLTKTFTRRYACIRFPKLSQKAGKRSRTMNVFLLDLNNFKIINDQFGHDVGDQVLSSVAAILKSVSSKTDIVCRWGGDEFIILSTCPSSEYLVDFTHRLGEELNHFNRKKQLNVDFSIGKAVFPDDGKTLSELVKVADINMYTEKAMFRKSEIKNKQIKTSAR